MFIFTDDEDIPPVDPGRVPVAPVLDLWGILPGDGAWFKPGPGGAGFDEPPPPMDRIREELARRKKKATKAPGGGGEDEAGRKKIENEADRKKIEDEAGRKKIAREAWLADLQSILRPKPLFTGSAVTTVQIDLGPLKGQAVKQGLPGSAAVPLALDDEPAEKRLSTPKASGDAPPKEKRPRVDDAKDPPSTAAAASAEPAKMGPPALVPLPGRPKAKPKAPAAEVVSAAEKRKQKEANALKLMPAAPKPPPAKRKRSNADSDDEPIFFLPRKKKGGSGGQAKLALVRGGHGRPGGGRLYRDSETDFDTDDLSDGSPDTTTSGGGGGCAGALLRGGGDGPVVLEDDDPLDFYGHQATEDAVRYQSRGVDTGKIPGPGAVRLDLEKLGRDMNLKKVTPAAIRAHPSSKVLHSEYADDFDEALKNVWVKDPSETPLIKGLPLVEEVVFFQVGNNIDPGNCYWRAVSHLVYGIPEYWARVKAEHLDYFSKVLENHEHPRRARYMALNKFRDVEVSGLPAGPDGTTAVRLNLFQLLCVRNAWVPAAMLEITADLYNAFFVLYTIRSNGDARTVTDVMTRGTFNARHLFMAFVGGNHFQPLTPNDYFSWEFQCPRLSREAVVGYTKRKERKADVGEKGHGITLSWRLELSRDHGAVPPPLPVEHVLGGMGPKNRDNLFRRIL